MTTTPILGLPTFSQDFFIEIEASGVGIEVILVQQGRPIAFSTKHWGRGILLDPHMKKT